MGYTLAVYGSDAFQEFIMPQTNDADFCITLAHAIYGFSGDVVLNFEIIGGVWRFVSMRGNAALRTNSLRFGEKLEVGSLIQIRQKDATVGIVAMETNQSLYRFQKYRITMSCKLEVGSAEGCNIVYDFRGLVSRTHAILELAPGSCRIIDNSRNGVYMYGKRIESGQNLKFGDVVNIFGLQIIWLGAVLAIGASGEQMRVWAPELQPLKHANELYPGGFHQTDAPVRRMFHRSPRLLPQLNTEAIEIEPVPQPNRMAKRPLLLTIGPSMTMVLPMMMGSVIAIAASGSSGGVSPYMFTGIAIAITSAALGVMWALINLRHAKKEEQAAEENRATRYQSYLYGIEQEIKTKAEENFRMLAAAYPSAAECARYDAYCSLLWNRNMSHPDLLFVRLGIGDTEFQCPIHVPKRAFTLYDDELAEQPRVLQERYRILKDVPVGIDLQERRLIGIAGGGSERAVAAVIRTIATQIAANNCYTDVKMVFICKEKTLADGGAWSFARWLPHVWSENKATRYCACSQTEINEVCFELSEVIRKRTEQTEASQEQSQPRPHYVIFLEDPELLGNEGILKYLLEPKPCYGLTSIIMAAQREMLPNACEDIIETNGTGGSIYNLGTGVVGGTQVTFDVISRQMAEQFARKISSVEVSEMESSGAIPDAITFLDLWGVKTLEELNVLDRWRKNRTYETMRALIGQKAGGQNWYLDIHEKHHGPHGLVAGTTGSGKSETLQTYVLSLAMCYSPDDVAFFIIDYKGGGMANLFSNTI